MLVYQRVYIHISGFSGCVTCHPACVWRDCLVFCVFVRSNLRLVVIVTIPFLPSLGENPWRIIPGIMPRQGCHGLNIPFKAPENHGFSGSSDGFFGFFLQRLWPELSYFPWFSRDFSGCSISISKNIQLSVQPPPGEAYELTEAGRSFCLSKDEVSHEPNSLVDWSI